MAQRIRQALGREDGFAGIEALVVVALGVMLAVAVPSFLGLRSGSADGATKDSLRAAMPAADAYYADHHRSYKGLDSTDLIRIDPRVSLTVAVTWAKRSSYCLTENVNGKTWSVKGPNPELISDTSATKGWYEGDTCR